MKDEIIEFFKPDKTKLAVAFLFPYVVLLISILSKFLLEPTNFVGLFKTYFYFQYFTFMTIYSLLIYPLVCSIILIYRAFRAKKLKVILSQKTTLGLVVLSLIFSNPPIVSIFAYLFNLVILTYFYTSFVPGVQVVDDSINTQTGLDFGKKIYGIRIYKSDSLFVEKEIRNTEDFYSVISNIQEGDKIRYKILPEFTDQIGYSEVMIVNVSRLKTIKVQNIGSKSILMVEVVKVRWYSPFYKGKVDEGDKIYRIDVYSRTSVKNDHGYKWIKTDAKSFRINDSEDFYNALNSAKVGERITLYGYRGGGTAKTEKNITDWGITVRDIELK